MASKRFLELVDQIKDLHERKNAGYAGKDAVDPWANFRMAEMMDISAFQGCLVRMSDKFIRVSNLSKDLQNDQVGESITDTLLDLAVYSLIAICLYEEQLEKANFAQAGMYSTYHHKESDVPIMRGRIVDPSYMDRFNQIIQREDGSLEVELKSVEKIVDWELINEKMQKIINRYLHEDEKNPNA